MTGWILLGIIVVVLVWITGMFNGLVRLRNQVKNAWSQIDVQLKRRHDLIPNLVEAVKAYMKHESETLEQVTRARYDAMQATGPAAVSQAEEKLTGALGRLMLIAENYPDLKSNQNFLALQEELTATENKVSFARQFYNDVVMQFNTRIESVPTNIVAGMFGFKVEDFFELTSREERDVPTLDFDSNEK